MTPTNSQEFSAGRKALAARYAMVTGSVGGLLLGLLAGSVSHGSDSGFVRAINPYINGIGLLWLNALAAVVIPLAVTNVISAVLRGGDARQSGRMSARALVLFWIWMTIGAILTLAIMPMVLGLMTVDVPTVADMLKSIPADALAAAQARPAPSSPGDYVAMFMPRNLLKAATNEEILPLLIVSIAFAFAVLRTNEESRTTITRGFRAVSDTLMVLIGWLVALMPLGAFATAYTFTASAGWGVAGIIGQFTILSSAAMVAMTLLMYPLTWLAAGVPMRQFAAAVWPAQVSALSTRSSLASLPALLEGGVGRLGLRPEVANFALPLSVAVFKVNRSTSTLIKLMFVAYIMRIDLTWLQLLTFTATTMLLSFTTLGIPNGGGGLKSLAAYLAIGLPIEAYVLLSATESIIDIFKTVLNVTADMSVAAVLDRQMKVMPNAAPDIGVESLGAAA